MIVRVTKIGKSWSYVLFCLKNLKTFLKRQINFHLFRIWSTSCLWFWAQKRPWSSDWSWLWKEIIGYGIGIGHNLDFGRSLIVTVIVQLIKAGKVACPALSSCCSCCNEICQRFCSKSEENTVKIRPDCSLRIYNTILLFNGLNSLNVWRSSFAKQGFFTQNAITVKFRKKQWTVQGIEKILKFFKQNKYEIKILFQFFPYKHFV